MTKPITIELLKKHKACYNQVEKFKEIFGEEVIPTRELCILHAQDFDFGWARTFLNKFTKVYNDEDIATAWKVYYEAIAPDQKAFNPAYKIFKEAAALAWFDAWANQ